MRLRKDIMTKIDKDIELKNKNHAIAFSPAKIKFILFLILLCCLPTLLNFAGIDFSSASFSSAQINNSDALFVELSGTLHHAILEWTAVSIAIIASILSVIHYQIKKDIAIPIIGMALFCAGTVDAFHTLAATRIIEANAPNSDFIPFTWALSRIFNASIIICGTLLSLWLFKKSNHEKYIHDYNKNNNNIKLLVLTGVLFISAAYLSVHMAAVSTKLPTTIFKDAFITRPYDVLPLGLFIFSGTLLFTLFRTNPSIAKFGLLLSIMPEIAAQLHMAFGSIDLFDNHFNIAHALKIVAYSCIFFGILFDLKVSNNQQHYSDINETAASSNHLKNSQLANNQAENLLEIGHVRQPFAIQFSAAVFILSITIAILFSTLFYSESEQLLFKQNAEELAIESKLIAPLIEQLYEQSYADVLFLSKTPPIMGIVDAVDKQDNREYLLWKNRLEKIFVSFLEAKQYYAKIRYIGVDNNGLELVNVDRSLNKIPFAVPQSQLQQKESRGYFAATIQKNIGSVYFSEINLNKEHGKISIPHRPTLRVATPIYHPTTGQAFGFIIISVNFDYFISQLKNNNLANLQFYLANEAGDFISHPNPDKEFGFDLQKQYLLQDEFPQLTDAINGNDSTHSLIQIMSNEVNYSGHYSRIVLDKFDNQHSLRLLILRNSISSQNALETFKTRSLVLGIALTIVASGFAILVAMRVVKPLTSIISTIEKYDRTGSVEKLPISAKNEVGVLARNFHNLFTQMRYTLQQQTILANEAEEATKQLNSVINTAADAIITISNDGCILSFNQAAEIIFGYTQEEIIGKKVNCLMPENLAQQHDGYIAQYLQTGRAGIIGVGRELTAIKKSGKQFPIHLAISEVSTESGVIFTGIIRDISHEKEHEQLREKDELALKQANERTTLATNSAGIGIWEYDIVEEVLTWDDWMFKLYEKSPKDFSNKFSEWQNTVHPDDLSEAENKVHQAITENKPFSADFRIICPSGKIKYLKSSALIDYDEKGNATKMVGVNYDITEIREAEIAHMEAKELAEHTARHKSEFLASMSHEIRTPMNGVLGMLGLLMRSDLSDDQLHRVKLANSSAESLLTLINDILDFSKVEAGKLDLEILDFDLLSLLGEFAETYGFKGQEKGLEVVLDVHNINCSHVKGDPGRIRQILTNLVGNAIKFTNKGEIVIRAEVKDLSDEELIFSCSISDTGIGIPQHKLKDIFSSFTQVDSSTTRQFGGTGLGLAITEQLCQLMSGNISVESTEGKGSCFSFEILLNKSHRSTLVIPSVDIKGVHLLVVDDNHTNRMVLKEQFELWGAKVTEAENGIAALAILESKLRPDFKVAFLDMQMPYMDGAELGNRIREIKALDKLKLVMMTSMATRGDASYFAKLGFNAYFPKPTTTSDLFDTLALTLSDSELIKQAQPLITHHYLKGLNHENPNGIVKNNKQQSADISETLSNNELLADLRLLLVEDNRVNQEVASHVLAEFGIHCDIAADGLEAIESLKFAAKDIPYEMILMDCQMPEMDGYQATKAIRSGKAGNIYKKIPIIAMTANAMKGDREKCINSGMDDYLAKPIEPASLKEKLILWADNAINVNKPKPGINTKSTKVSKTEIKVSDKTTNAKAESTSENNLESSAENNAENKISDIIWDKEALLKRVSNNEKITQKLIQLFLDEMPQQLDLFAKALAQQDKKTMSSCVHKVKGMSANISALQLLSTTKHIESTIDDNSVSDDIYQDFLSKYQALQQQLESDNLLVKDT